MCVPQIPVAPRDSFFDPSVSVASVPLMSFHSVRLNSRGPTAHPAVCRLLSRETREVKRGRIPVYLERGAKTTFACAVEWPGWIRGGRDEVSALEALLAAGPRYARALKAARLAFSAPSEVSAFEVVARHNGNATTDFGAPGVMPTADERDMDESDVERTSAIMRVVWRAFDTTVASARGKHLAKGPRGGGRDLGAIVRHVFDAESGYVAALGWKGPAGSSSSEEHRKAVLDGLAASARGDIPARGPRGGKRWRPRFFARRLTWHALDHAWEIEDRSA